MPICPGCEQTLTYSQLDVHQRYCDGVRSGGRDRRQSVEKLEQRLATLEERMEGRIWNLETDFERRLLKLERQGRSKRPRRE